VHDKTRELEDKKAHFTEKCAKQRQEVREVTEGGFGEEELRRALEGTLEEGELEEMKMEMDSSPEKTQKQKATLKAKPKWAMTTEENDEVEVPTQTSAAVSTLLVTDTRPLPLDFCLTGLALLNLKTTTNFTNPTN
jgi:hypothetical protein